MEDDRGAATGLTPQEAARWADAHGYPVSRAWIDNGCRAYARRLLATATARDTEVNDLGDHELAPRVGELACRFAPRGDRWAYWIDAEDLEAAAREVKRDEAGRPRPGPRFAGA